MKFGVCRGLDDTAGMIEAKKAGVDYWETGFGCLARFSDGQIDESKAVLQSLSLECSASNGFIPGDMKIVGDNVDYGELCDYLDRGFERAKMLGVKTIVLGSGRARSYPDNYSENKAKEQIAFFLSEYAAPKALKAGCIITLEPLRICESNIIHTVADGIEIARMSGAPNVFGLADLYHVYGNGDDVDGISGFIGKVKHAHISEPVKRRYPSLSDSEEIKDIYKKFLLALSVAGCGRCSIEAGTDDFASDVSAALSLLKAISVEIC